MMCRRIRIVARYRAVQQAFTGGMLDPMIEANILSAQRQLGVKESRNMWHRPDGPVEKRVGTAQYAGLGIMDSPSSPLDMGSLIRIDMPLQACLVGLINNADGTTGFAFEYSGLSGVCNIDDDEFQMDHSLSHFAVTIEQVEEDGKSLNSYIIMETQAGWHPVMYRITLLEEPRTDGHLTMRIDHELPDMSEWAWDKWPTTCCFAGGRLFLGFDDTIIASRSPEDGKNRFFDFKMADWEYKWVLESEGENFLGFIEYSIYYNGDTGELKITSSDPYKTWAYSERIDMTSTSGYSNVPDEKNIVKKTKTLRRHELRIYPDDLTEISEMETSDYLYAIFPDEDEWNDIALFKEDPSIDEELWGKYVGGNLVRNAITETTYSTTDPTEIAKQTIKLANSGYKSIYPSELEISPTMDKQFTDLGITKNFWNTYGFEIEYKVTENYADGILQATSITITEKNLDLHRSATKGASEYPADDLMSEISYTRSDESESPTVYSSHAIELHETDMFGSSLQWMANIGRLVAATEDAVYISTSELFEPATFDLTPTIYTGSASIQPSIVGSMISFVTADRRRIYGAIYSNEIQGLVGIELTQFSRSLFWDRIKWLRGSDSPFLSLYAITEGGRMYEGNVMATESGSMAAAWSEWKLEKGIPEMVMPMRKLSSASYETEESPWLYIKARLSDGRVLNIIHEYSEPYAYDLMESKPSFIHHARAFRQLPIDSQMAVIIEKIEEEGLWRMKPYDASWAEPGAMYPFSDGTKVTAVLCHLDWTPSAFILDAEIVSGDDGLMLKLPSSYSDEPSGAAIIGFPVSAGIQLFQQLLPNNSGIVFQSKHSVIRIEMQIFKSAGGSVWYSGRKVRDILQLEYGKDTFGNDFIDPDTERFRAFSGTYAVDNPTDLTLKDELSIESPEPYPFSLMAVGLLYNVTEVN